MRITAEYMEIEGDYWKLSWEVKRYDRISNW